MAVTGRHIGAEIARALNLPPETTDILINIGLEDAITVWCRHYPSADALRAMTTILSHYTLTPGPDVPEGLFTQDQRIRLFRQGILRGAWGVESPYLKRYLACTEELAALERLTQEIPDGIDVQVLTTRMTALREQRNRMEAGEAC